MRIYTYALAALLAGAGLTATACSHGNPPSSARSNRHETATAAPAKSTAVGIKLSDSPYGKILTDEEGRTLYGFLPDKKGMSSCGNTCVATWPPLTSKTPVTTGAGITASLLTMTSRAEGTTQATYGDWPLYYYAGDMTPGDIDGQGVDKLWFVIGADGKLIKTTD